MREEVKLYIETADEKVVQMVYAMLEVDADAGWWESMPDEVKQELEVSLEQGKNGQTLTHDEVKAKYRQ
jgi:hypothetical protein